MTAIRDEFTKRRSYRHYLDAKEARRQRFAKLLEAWQHLEGCTTMVAYFKREADKCKAGDEAMCGASWRSRDQLPPRAGALQRRAPGGA
jgi:hypothetical protein